MWPNGLSLVLHARQIVGPPILKASLLNGLRDEDKATMDMYLLDRASLKLTKKFGNTPPVFDWVAAK
jgi:hypothetical protein